MPIDPSILGFSNVWYADAMDHAAVVAGPEGHLRTLDAPHFCATKLEAFSARGDGDYLHHDLEDFIAVVDGRATLTEELAAAPDALRAFVAMVVSDLLATEAFVDALPGHLEGDAGSQARLPLLIARLRGIGALQVLREEGTPARPGARSDTSTAPRALVPAPGPPTAFRGSVPPVGMPFSIPSGRIALRSSNLRALEYEASSLRLTIEFHSGGIYLYSHVPEKVVQGLLRAYSAGRYHHQWIRGRYRHRRVR
jgi:KTSC domain